MSLNDEGHIDHGKRHANSDGSGDSDCAAIPATSASGSGGARDSRSGSASGSDGDSAGCRDAEGEAREGEALEDIYRVIRVDPVAAVLGGIEEAAHEDIERIVLEITHRLAVAEHSARRLGEQGYDPARAAMKFSSVGRTDEYLRRIQELADEMVADRICAEMVCATHADGSL